MALIGKAVSVRKMFENGGHIHEYSPRAGAENPLGSFFFSLTVCLPVLEEKIFKGFYHIWHGGHLVHVTGTIYINSNK